MNELVLVDDREPSDALPRLADLGLAPTKAHLDAADYAFYPHGLTCLIERKTMSDLLTSIASKRLITQIHRMLEASDRAFLLREGTFRRNPNGMLAYFSPRDPRRGDDGYVESGWYWDAFASMMVDLQMLGVVLIDCPILGQYPTEIARLVINLAKNEHKWVSERERPDFVYLDKQWRNAVWSWAAYDKVGTETATELLREYSTSYELMRGVVEEPGSVAAVKIGGRAFGMKRAEHLRREVLQEWVTTSPT